MMSIYRVIRQAGQGFAKDDCMSGGAAMAYYAIFSMPALMIVVFTLAGYLGVSEERIEGIVRSQVGMPSVAAPDDTSAMAQGPSILGGTSIIGRAVGIGLLLFSATGLFAQLQFALNRAWEVEPDPEGGGVARFALKRIMSLGMIVVIAFLLFISFILTTLLNEIVGRLAGETSGVVAQTIAYLSDNLGTWLVATMLFAAIYKVLPDAKLAWRDVWMGAALTAVLFLLGKLLIGLYLNRTKVGVGWDAAAGSTIAALVWIYYTSLIVLFGAELTQAWARENGRHIEPAEGAVRKKEVKRYVRESTGQGEEPAASGHVPA